jgi:membrane-associated phospholipid phosphatase
MSVGWKRPLGLAFACCVLFAAAMLAAYYLPLARWADGWAVEGFLNLQTPWLADTAGAVSALANPVPFAIWTVLLAGAALRQRRPRRALAVVVLLVGANVIAQALKSALAHDRHHAFLGEAQIPGASFPSGHATASMSLAFAAVLVAPLAWRPVVAALGALFALAVSESIMLLGWHFPSDVLGGFLVATASALATVAALRAADARWPERTGREAARRAFDAVDLRRAAALAVAFVAAVLVTGALAAGAHALRFADRHTTAVFAAVVVAALAGVLPVTVAAFGARRS